MSQSIHLANRFREVILDGKWVANTNLKDQLLDVTLEQALTQVANLNSIAALTFHINYYISGVLNFFEGGNLDIRDKFSFDAPPLRSQADWIKLTHELWANAEKFAAHVELMSEEKLNEVFVDEKYGSFQRNIEALIEHSYYHMGQISLIRKLLNEGIIQ